jgi:hypothetical protein
MTQLENDSIQGISSDKLDAGALEEAKKKGVDSAPEYEDPFGNEEFADVKYRTLYWW